MEQKFLWRVNYLMNRELISRRETLLNQMTKGRKLQSVAEEIVNNSGITEAEARERLMAAVIKDWNNKDRWIPNIIRLQDPSLLEGIVAALNAVTPEAWAIYNDAEADAGDKVAALRTIQKNQAILADILLKTGFIKAAPTVIEGTVNIATIPFKASPALQALLDTETKKQLAEKTERERLEAEQKAKEQTNK